MLKIIFSILLFLPSYSFACSCLHQPLSKHVAGAKNIYVGVLTSSRIVEAKSDKEWPYVEGTIKVETTIKGSPEKLETVRTGFGGGDCGIPMIVGRAYVIFFENEQHHIGSCGASGLIERYQEKEFVDKLKALVNE